MGNLPTINELQCPYCLRNNPANATDCMCGACLGNMRLLCAYCGAVHYPGTARCTVCKVNLVTVGVREPAPAREPSKIAYEGNVLDNDPDTLAREHGREGNAVLLDVSWCAGCRNRTHEGPCVPHANMVVAPGTISCGNCHCDVVPQHGKCPFCHVSLAEPTLAVDAGYLLGNAAGVVPSVPPRADATLSQNYNFSLTPAVMAAAVATAVLVIGAAIILIFEWLF